MTQSSPPSCSWRPGDSEALRIALSIPVTAAALGALRREMALLQTHYPTGVCTAQSHLDAIAALDQQLGALTPAELAPPVLRRHKGISGGAVPEPLPLRKVAVVEYATELLLEETETHWDPQTPSAAVVLGKQRFHHIGELALLLPRLQGWRHCNPDPFLGTLLRG